MALERIIVVPRNGYANRLQAWASSSALSEIWQVPLEVCWEPEPIAPATQTDFFDPDAPVDWITPEELTDLLGSPHHMLPRYLTEMPERGLLVLAGHDRGEQHFMHQMREGVERAAQPLTLVIMAGGQFGVVGDQQQRAYRSQFYRALPWSRDISHAVETALAGRGPFIGLHIRQTDRSREAPTPKQLNLALRAMVENTGIRDAFIAADSSVALARWRNDVTSMGFNPWSVQTRSHDRGSRQASIDALIEWQILGHSSAVIYSARSSFGAEAAVMAGNVPIAALQSSANQQRLRALREMLRAAVTYPARHWPSAKD